MWTPLLFLFVSGGEGIGVVCVILATHNSKKAAEERADAAPVIEHAHPAVRVQRMGVLRNCPSRRECINYIASKRAHVEGACARARAPTRARERWARAVHFKNESHISSNLISQNLISAATVHLPEDKLITRASKRANDSPDPLLVVQICSPHPQQVSVAPLSLQAQKSASHQVCNPPQTCRAPRASPFSRRQRLPPPAASCCRRWMPLR